MASCLDCSILGGAGDGGRGCHRSLPSPPPSQWSIGSHGYHSKSSLLALHSQQEHVPWASTRFLVMAQTTDTAPRCSKTMDAGEALRGSPRMSTWPQVAAQAAHISMASDCSKAREHQHGHRLQSRPQTPTWPLVVAWAMVINTDSGCSRTTDPDMALSGSTDTGITMASSGNAGHSHQRDLWQQYGPRVQTAAQTRDICVVLGGNVGHWQLLFLKV